MVEPHTKALGYRWWTVAWWHTTGDQGVKLGPVSCCRYFQDAVYGWRWVVTVLGWTLCDTWGGAR